MRKEIGSGDQRRRLQSEGHEGVQTHRTAHQAPPRLRQEVTTGGRKHPHQLLQRFELKTNSLRLAENIKEEEIEV